MQSQIHLVDRVMGIAPSIVLRLGGAGPMYVCGYCHLRQKERVFHLDRIVPVGDEGGMGFMEE
jgi:hypothetical protein